MVTYSNAFNSPARDSGPAPFTVIDPTPNSPASSFASIRRLSLSSLDDEVDVKFYPPDPNYNIAERPWLPGPQKPYILLNAKLIDPRASKVHKNMTLHLAEGKIISVTPTTARDITSDFYHGDVKALKIDVSKYFICPGLIDCHVHLMATHGAGTLHGAFTFPHEQAIFQSAGLLRGILAHGFTTVRDTGGATIAHAKATEEWLVPGPRVFQGGRMLSQTGGHGDDTEVWMDDCCTGGAKIGTSALGRLCDGVPECLRAARDNMRKGANHVKVCTSGGIASQTDKLESLQFTVEELQAITTVVKNMGGTRVTAHCYTAEGIRHAIAGGITGIEHGNMLDAETAKLMVKHDVVLTPTLGLHTFCVMPPYDKFQTPEGKRKNAIVGNSGLKAIRIAEEVGVCVCYGTDTTGPTLVMQTYDFVVRASLLPSPVVLKQATINGAKNVGMEGLLGELIPGAFADLLFLNENPLEDVTCFDRYNENLMGIMKDGRIVKSKIEGLKVERACDWE